VLKKAASQRISRTTDEESDWSVSFVAAVLL